MLGMHIFGYFAQSASMAALVALSSPSEMVKHSHFIYGLRPLPPASLLASDPFFGGHLDSELVVLNAVWFWVWCLVHVLVESM